MTIQVRTYQGPDPASAAAAFQEDAATAAQEGFEPASQTWADGSLVVTYRRSGWAQRNEPIDTGRGVVIAVAVVLTMIGAYLLAGALGVVVVAVASALAIWQYRR